jgi:hypothetical protein
LEVCTKETSRGLKLKPTGKHRDWRGIQANMLPDHFDGEVELLRSILRKAHETKEPLPKKLIRGLRDKFVVRDPKKTDTPNQKLDEEGAG